MRSERGTESVSPTLTLVVSLITWFRLTSCHRISVPRMFSTYVWQSWCWSTTLFFPFSKSSVSKGLQPKISVWHLWKTQWSTVPAKTMGIWWYWRRTDTSRAQPYPLQSILILFANAVVNFCMRCDRLAACMQAGRLFSLPTFWRSKYQRSRQAASQSNRSFSIGRFC